MLNLMLPCIPTEIIVVLDPMLVLSISPPFGSACDKYHQAHGYNIFSGVQELVFVHTPGFILQVAWTK